MSGSILCNMIAENWECMKNILNVESWESYFSKWQRILDSTLTRFLPCCHISLQEFCRVAIWDKLAYVRFILSSIEKSWKSALKGKICCTFSSILRGVKAYNSQLLPRDLDYRPLTLIQT